jgi:hypothetical protein
MVQVTAGQRFHTQYSVGVKVGNRSTVVVDSSHLNADAADQRAAYVARVMKRDTVVIEEHLYPNASQWDTAEVIAEYSK